MRPSISGLCASLLLVSACVTVLGSPVASATPVDSVGFDGGALAAAWTAAHDGPHPYADVSFDTDIPITMSDGTVLKADVVHPANGNRVEDKPLPTVLLMNPYSKLLWNTANLVTSTPALKDVLLPLISSFSAPGSGLEGITDLTQILDTGDIAAALGDLDLVRNGYTFVHVDIRGTGTSQGHWQVFGEREQQDTVEVIDWISKQPWNNGKVAMTGASYSGINQIQAAAKNPPALKAIFANEPGSDLINDVIAPGGGIMPVFLPAWLAFVNITKMAPNVEPLIQGKGLYGPAELQWFNDRLADPATFFDVIANAFGSTSIDQLSPKTRDVIDPNSAVRRALETDPQRITVPSFVVGGWGDLFANSETKMYTAMNLPPEKKKLIVGDGYHAGVGTGNFGNPGYPPRMDVLQQAWFDHWLKGIDNGIEKYPTVVTDQQGAGWSTAATYPRPGVEHQRMYLTDHPSGTAPHAVRDGALTATAPTPGPVTDLTVTPNLLGICSRDAAIATAGLTSIIVACTQDSRIREAGGLSFTSAPVTTPTHLSGPINVHLNTVHDGTDGYWSVTVNDVAPDGQSRQLSSGQLTTSLRAIDDAKSARSANGDYTNPAYFLDLAQRQTVAPGQPVTLDVAVIATDAVLQPGHRLRVDVFASNFPKGLPPTPFTIDSGLKPQHLRLDPNAPSWVNIHSANAFSDHYVSASSATR